MKKRAEFKGYVVDVRREPMIYSPRWQTVITLESTDREAAEDPAQAELLKALEAGEVVTLALETKDEETA